MSGLAVGPVAADGDEGVDELHEGGEVAVGGGDNEMDVVGHEDDVVDDDAETPGPLQDGDGDDEGVGLPLEAEVAVVDAAADVGGVFGLDDAESAGHGGDQSKNGSRDPLTPPERRRSAMAPREVLMVAGMVA